MLTQYVRFFHTFCASFTIVNALWFNPVLKFTISGFLICLLSHHFWHNKILCYVVNKWVHTHTSFSFNRFKIVSVQYELLGNWEIRFDFNSWKIDIKKAAADCHGSNQLKKMIRTINASYALIDTSYRGNHTIICF